MAVTKLYLALDEIYEAIEGLLIAEMTTNGRLDGIVAHGRMSTEPPGPPYPGIWYYQGSMTPSILTSTREMWQLPLVIASLTYSDMPGEGSKSANRYADEARAVLLESRNLGLDYVGKITSTKFEPAGPVDKRKTNFTALALVEIEFLTERTR